MKELTIKEVRSFGYQHPDLVKKYDAEQLIRQANAIRYIDHLAGITNTDMSDVKLHHFMNQNENLHVERTEINKIFFQLKEQIGPKAAEPEAIPRAKLLEIEKKIGDHMRLAFNQQERSMRSKRTHAAVAWKAAKKHSDGLLQASIDLENMRKCMTKGVDLMPMVEKVLNNSTFWQVTNVGFGFFTKPISLSYYNEAQDAENVVRLGQLKAEIQFKRGIRIKILPYQENVFTPSGLYHPHVNKEGDVCYGNFLDRAKVLEAEMDLYGLLDLVRTVLCNYNDENPYVHLYAFQELREGTDRSRAMAAATPQQLQDIGIDMDAESEYADDEPEEQEAEEWNEDENPD